MSLIFLRNLLEITLEMFINNTDVYFKLRKKFQSLVQLENIIDNNLKITIRFYNIWWKKLYLMISEI